MDYQKFLDQKSQLDGNFGFEPVFMPDFLFDFQKHLVEWSCLKGRSALFEDCGLGKTPQQLVFADNVVRKTNKNVLLLAPLGVTYQTKKEAEKFGIDATISRDGSVHKGITITNYEKLHLFNSNDFIGVVCDESSILKNYSGKIRTAIIKFLEKVPYRLLCTATPSPNDHTELGNSCEALGVMKRVQMLAMYFIHDSANTAQWRLKGHGDKQFWRFMASWARALRKPSDLGFSDEGYELPALNIKQHTMESEVPEGYLFAMERLTLNEQRHERRETIDKRCKKVAEIANGNDDPFVAWCSLNDESALLASLINDGIQITGSDKPEVKEEKLMAFSSGEVRALVAKPEICGFGMNWQHCANTSFFPSHSHEQFYQSIRRFWRFGQKQDVNVHIVTTEAESAVIANMKRKEKQSEELFQGIIDNMRSHYTTAKTTYNPQVDMEAPAWL